MIGKWWDGCVRMVVVLGFWCVHNGERKREEERQKLESGEKWHCIV